MKKLIYLALVCIIAAVNVASADTFGTGDNAFNIDFVTISANPGETRSTNTSGQSVETFTNGTLGPWTDPGYNYRMGIYEITNDQFAKFAANTPYYSGATIPANQVSWYEAAQFVNYLNTSTNNTAAYKFNGSTFAVWDVTDTGYDASNPFRNSNAKYFLPTENEWVKAAYWNGTGLQEHATKAGESLFQGNGTNEGWNYRDNGNAIYYPYGPWNVGSGSQELNGTYNMMGNVWEWMESPYYNDSFRVVRGGSYSIYYAYTLSSDHSHLGLPEGDIPGYENYSVGFRVASRVFEPYCGDWDHPYPSMDFNQDCRVNLVDFAMFAAHWMECSAPECD